MADANLGAWVVDTSDEVEWRIYGLGDRDTRQLIAQLHSRSADCAIVEAYNRGVDDAEKAIRESSADLLERSGRERAELEERVEQLERIGKHLLEEYEKEEEEYGFPFCFALRDAHRELGMALSDLKKEEEGDG